MLHGTNLINVSVGDFLNSVFEMPHDKTNKMASAPSETSDQPGHPPSLIRGFTVCMKKPWVLSYWFSTQQRLWSDWADAQSDQSLRWAHSHFVGFVMRRLISNNLSELNRMEACRLIHYSSWWFNASLWALPWGRGVFVTQEYWVFMNRTFWHRPCQ